MNRQKQVLTTNENLQRLIEAELLHNNRLSAHRIHVRVDGNQAVLSGQVKSHREKLLACQIALSFEEINDVIDDLEIQTITSLTDTEIELRIRQTLEASADVTAETIKISGHNGKVVLTGYVASFWERTVAGDLARGVEGVVSLENLLVVNREEKISDEELGNSIKAAFIREPELRDTNINIAVCDGIVELNGKVDKPWRRELAESIVRRFDILHIDNDIIVR